MFLKKNKKIIIVSLIILGLLIVAMTIALNYWGNGQSQRDVPSKEINSKDQDESDKYVFYQLNPVIQAHPTESEESTVNGGGEPKQSELSDSQKQIIQMFAEIDAIDKKMGDVDTQHDNNESHGDQ